MNTKYLTSKAKLNPKSPLGGWKKYLYFGLLVQNSEEFGVNLVNVKVQVALVTFIDQTGKINVQKSSVATLFCGFYLFIKLTTGQ